MKDNIKLKINEILMLFVSYIIFECFFIFSTNKFIGEDIEIFMEFIPHCISFLVYYLGYILLKNIINKPFVAGCINLVVLYLLGIISIIKVSFLGTPVLISDIKFLNSFGEINTLVNIGDVFSILGLGTIIAFVLIILFSLRIIYIGTKKSFKRNWKGLLLSCLTVLILFTPFVFENLADIHKPANSIIGTYISKGFYSGLYGQFLNERIQKPAGYSEKEIEEILEFNETNNSGSWGTPNVIFILSEAFWDINNIEEVKFNKDIMEGYNYVLRNSQEINMISPTYAGMTTNVEYELLTGNSMRYFGLNYVPFNSLYTTKKTAELPSVVKFFNNAGYDTKVISPFDNGRVYNVSTVYDYLGFKDILLKKDMEKEDNLKGLGVSDEYLYDFVLQELKNNDKNTFLFLKTAQNHMPYRDDKYSEFDIEIVDSNLSDEETFRTRIFGQGIYDANVSLKKLYDEIQMLEEPTVVVFFGDHLPSLTTADGTDIISKLNLMKDSKLQAGYEKYHTKSLIFSNYEIKTEDFCNLSFDGLSAYIMNNLDIETDNYYKWLYFNLPNYAGGNAYVSADINGNLKYISDFNSEEAEIYKKKMYYQYYILTK